MKNFYLYYLYFIQKYDLQTTANYIHFRIPFDTEYAFEYPKNSFFSLSLYKKFIVKALLNRYLHTINR